MKTKERIEDEMDTLRVREKEAVRRNEWQEAYILNEMYRLLQWILREEAD